jgi:catalase
MVSVTNIDTDLGEVLAENEEQSALEIAQLMGQQIEKTYPADKRPARRDAHPKSHGCVRATFRVEDQLPENLAQGVFVPGKTYQAWIRFSNGDANASRPDAKGDGRGMAIKLCGVPGEKILPDQKDATTQDFIMINHPVFLVDDPQSYLSVIKKTGSSNPLVRLTAPIAIGFKGAVIATAITSAKIASPLEARYWSTTAYRLGDDQHKQAIKFSARPCLASTSKIPDDPGPDFLRETMIEQLASGDVQFDFLVQPRTSPSMSVENSMVEWKESEAPFHKVATITIPKQTFSSPGQEEFGENLSFTPWHCLPEHRPLGAVNRVRRVVYEQISALRHNLNGVTRREPTGEETFE